jgi:hypothetical protein
MDHTASLRNVLKSQHTKHVMWGVGIVAAGVSVILVNKYYSSAQARLNSQQTECLVCLETVPSSELIQITRGCNHPNSTCKQCLYTYVDINLRSKRHQQLKCPHINCSQSMGSEDIKRTCGIVMHDLFIHLQTVYAEQNHPNYRYCATPDCRYGMIVNVPIVDRLNLSSDDHDRCLWECPECDGENCFLHRTTFGQCDDVQAHSNTTKNELELVNRASGDFAQCPNCNMGISKDGGCAHMKCESCSTEFCWNCHQRYRNGFCSHSVRCSYFWASSSNDLLDIDDLYFEADSSKSAAPWWIAPEYSFLEIVNDLPLSNDSVSESGSSWISSFLQASSNASDTMEVLDSTAIVLNTVWKTIQNCDSDDDSLDEYWPS